MRHVPHGRVVTFSQSYGGKKDDLFSISSNYGKDLGILLVFGKLVCPNV